MTPDILDFIKQLSKDDPKTLTQQALKLAEETGELAKAVLPYELAHGTLHRIVSRSGILEEAVDNILVSLSIAYKLGFTDEDIGSTMQRKALYWAQLQQNESVVNLHRIPHEIHVTVEMADDVEKFKADCKAAGVKAVLLDLHTKSAGPIKDLMTSQVVVGTTPEAFDAMNLTKTKLSAAGYNVVRGKIEAAPWHPSVPTLNNGFKCGADNYFEAHVEVHTDESTPNSSVAHLKEIMRGMGVHVSSNAFKTFGDVAVVMVTLRRGFGTIEGFKRELAQLRERISSTGYPVSDKLVVEYAVFDSNVKHDQNWMNARE